MLTGLHDNGCGPVLHASCGQVSLEASEKQGVAAAKAAVMAAVRGAAKRLSRAAYTEAARALGMAARAAARALAEAAGGVNVSFPRLFLDNRGIAEGMGSGNVTPIICTDCAIQKFQNSRMDTEFICL